MTSEGFVTCDSCGASGPIGVVHLCPNVFDSADTRKNATREIAAEDRKWRALDLRRAGKTYDAIARDLGYFDRAAAHKAVQQALEERIREPAEEVRKLETDRLDAMLEALWPKVLDGQDKSIGTALRIMERRSRLWGLDAPTRIDVLDLAREEAKRLGIDPAELTAEIETIRYEGGA